jgi:hypothetical protein
VGAGEPCLRAHRAEGAGQNYLVYVEKDVSLMI